MKKILILDANQRSALAVTRSLGSIPELYVYCSDSSPFSLSGSSNCCDQYIQSPLIEESTSQYISWLEDIVNSNSISIIFPCTEVTSQLILKYRNRFTNAIIPFADIDVVMELANKARLVELAKKLNIPVPDTILCSTLTDTTYAKQEHFPLVVKPATSIIWEKDTFIKTEVKIVDSKEKLDEIKSFLPYGKKSEFLLQEYIPGHGEGIFAIYNRGNAVAFFAHKRVREKPPEGGVSVLCESVQPDKLLVELSKLLLDSVNWHGVAMVEFRVDPLGKPYLMEVNTRFWGSLQLALDSGVDFPRILYNVVNNEPVTELKSYKTGVRLRWFLGDLDSLYLVMKNKNYTIKEKLKRILYFFTPYPFSTRHQVARWGDIGPGIAELKQYFKNIFNR